MNWAWPLLHWAAALVLMVAVGYGIWRYVVSDLRAQRRARRDARRDARP